MILIGFASVYLLSSSCNFNLSTLQVLELGLGVLERSQWWAPRATSAQVPRVHVQVQFGFASLDLDSDSGDLSRVDQVHLPPL